MNPPISSISISNPLEKGNEIWATCNIYGSEDTDNHIILTVKKLVITTNSRTYSFPINAIQSISTRRIKYLLPIILGGIAGPLSLLSIYENIYPATFLMLLFIASIFLIYYGFTGSEALIINSTGNEQIIFLKEISNPLNEFIRFANILIPQFGRNDQKIYLFAVLLREQYLQSPNDLSHIDNKFILTDIQVFTKISLEGYLRNFSEEERSKMKIARIDPGKLSSRVKLQKFKDGSHGLFMGHLNSDSVEELLNTNNFIN